MGSTCCCMQCVYVCFCHAGAHVMRIMHEKTLIAHRAALHRVSVGLTCSRVLCAQVAQVAQAERRARDSCLRSFISHYCLTSAMCSSQRALWFKLPRPTPTPTTCCPHRWRGERGPWTCCTSPLAMRVYAASCAGGACTCICLGVAGRYVLCILLYHQVVVCG